MISKEQLEKAKEQLKQIGALHVVVTVWDKDDTCALENKAVDEHFACDIPEEKPYADLIAFMLNNATDLLANAEAVAV